MAPLPIPAEMDVRLVPHIQRHDPVDLNAVRIGVNHQEAYNLDGDIYTNNAESFFSRIRRAETGHHHHLAGPYPTRFAQESASLEDHRKSNCTLRILE